MTSRYLRIVLSIFVVFSVGFAYSARAETSVNLAAPSASKADLHDWQKAINEKPTNPKGCYQLKYPSTTWTKVECGKPPTIQPSTIGFIQLPGKLRPNALAPPLVGDWTMTPSQTISSATGTIQALTNVTSAGSLDRNHNNAYAANIFSLQINTDNSPGLTASSGNPSCAQSTNTSCRGWMQFVYNTKSNQIYVQFWLLSYLNNVTTSCPAGFPFTDKGQKGTPQVDCGINVAAVNNLPSALDDITKMQGATLTGQLSASSTVVITLTVGGVAYRAIGTAVGGATNATWTTAEFNIFGAGGFGKVNTGQNYQVVQLNNAAEISMGLSNDNDSSGKAPACPASPQSFTFENSNMFLGPCNSTATPEPSIFFNESHTTPQITSINPTQGRVAGGTSVQVLGGPFNQQFEILFTNASGSQIAAPTNTLPNDVSVSSPPGIASLTDQVTAAYIFPNGYPGPFGAPARFTYFTTPGCQFSGFFCPFDENQPPQYTATCSTPSDFYTSIDSAPAHFVLQAQKVLTFTGPSAQETQLLAACEAGSTLQCNFYSVETFTKCVPSGSGGGGLTCTKCSGKKCCLNPNGGGDICVAKNLPCPVLQ